MPYIKEMPWYREELNERRVEAVKVLGEMDPDVLVGDLDISSQELLERFPDKVAEYLRENVGE